MTFKQSSLKLSVSFCALLMIGGCQISTDGPVLDSLQGQKARTEQRISVAAEEAIKAGQAHEALQFYETLYARNHNDPEIAVNYAYALRKTDGAQRAIMVLAPFITPDETDKKKKPEPVRADVLLEYAAASLALGRYERAVEVSQEVIGRTDAKSELYHAKAYHLAGIGYDALSQYKDAETSYRIAMELWPGQPVPVMNNLALSLAQRGLFDDSLTMLRQARVMDPSAEEIARNIQIVTDLRDNLIPRAN